MRICPVAIPNRLLPDTLKQIRAGHTSGLTCLALLHFTPLSDWRRALPDTDNLHASVRRDARWLDHGLATAHAGMPGFICTIEQPANPCRQTGPRYSSVFTHSAGTLNQADCMGSIIDRCICEPSTTTTHYLFRHATIRAPHMCDRPDRQLRPACWCECLQTGITSRLTPNWCP